MRVDADLGLTSEACFTKEYGGRSESAAGGRKILEGISYTVDGDCHVCLRMRLYRLTDCTERYRLFFGSELLFKNSLDARAVFLDCV